MGAVVGGLEFEGTQPLSGPVVAVREGGHRAGGAGAAVGVDTVQVLVLVGRGDVDADLDPMGTHRVGERAQYVAAAVLPAAGDHTVVRVTGGVEDEAVVVLDGEDGEFEAAVAQRPRPLVGVQSGRLEDIGAFLTRAPFQAGEGIDAEVQERRLLQPLPGYLTLGRAQPGGLGHQLVRGVVRADGDAVAGLDGYGGVAAGRGQGLRSEQGRTGGSADRGERGDEEASAESHGQVLRWQGLRWQRPRPQGPQTEVSVAGASVSGLRARPAGATPSPIHPMFCGTQTLNFDALPVS